MSRGTALALSAMMGMCAVDGICAQDFHRFDAADAGQVDVHQDHVRLIGAREFDAEIAVRRTQQAQVGAARDELLDQFQVGRVVFDIEQGASRRAVRRLRVRASAAARLAGLQARCARQAQFDPEHAAHADGAVHADGAAHQFDQPLGHHQADAGAFLRAGFLPSRLNGWNSCASCSGASPAPVSRTLMRIESRGASAHSTTTVPPGLLYLMALNSRLIRTCLTRVRSA